MSNWPPEHPRVLIPELCRLFYDKGWVTGTGGGISIRDTSQHIVYIAPSGVQKERIQPDDIFELSDSDASSVIRRPDNPNLKLSDCTPLFFNAYRLRNAAACIHTHSAAAVLVTMIDPAATEFRIGHIEMIKGLLNRRGEAHLFQDVISVPIIDNTNYECDLTANMAAAIEQYPDTHCVLVRRHGAYIWGPTWQRAKTIAECYDYLFTIAIEMKKLGISWVSE